MRKVNKVNHRPLIIGAGPAGLACALECAKYGIPITIIERQSIPGKYNSCAGGISEGIVKKYNIPDGLIKRVYEYEIYYRQKILSFKLKGKNPILTTIRRENLEGFLYKLAKKQRNIFFELNTNVYKVKKLNDVYQVFTIDNKKNKKIFYATHIIFADGPNSLARKFGLGRKINDENFIAFSGYDDAYMESGKIFIEKNDWGYLWKFPHIDGTNIGYGTLIKNRERYLQKIKKFKKNLSHFTSGIVPINLSKRFCKDKMYIVGDAAGFVNPITGGGLIYAFLSGIRVAEHLKSKLLSRRKSNFNLKIYFSKFYIWLIFMHIIYNFFYTLHKLKVKKSYFFMLTFYFKLMKYIYTLAKSL